jgi:hypothetical protein
MLTSDITEWLLSQMSLHCLITIHGPRILSILCICCPNLTFIFIHYIKVWILMENCATKVSTRIKVRATGPAMSTNGPGAFR